MTRSLRGRALLLTGAMLSWLSLLAPVGALDQEAKQAIQVKETDEYIQIDTDALQARIRKKGYVSGVAQGSLLDRKTGARDAGFGLHIMDFLLSPSWRDDEYPRTAKYHGNLPRHLIEGPQICTQAKKLTPEIIRGTDFVAVRLRYRYTQAGSGYKPGSTWEQTLVFKPGLRYFVGSERITCVNDAESLLYRIDMPGHIRHNQGDTFSQVYLSYHGTIPAKEFSKDFAPDERFLYQRKPGKTPQRMIRAYQVKVEGKPGPWLAGMTLDADAVYEAWCHQRGYVCFIEELHGKQVKAGDSIGAAYLVGYFDDIPAMERAYDQYRGAQAITIRDGKVIVK
jgi:hypothetical protein